MGVSPGLLVKGTGGAGSGPGLGHVVAAALIKKQGDD